MRVAGLMLRPRNVTNAKCAWISKSGGGGSRTSRSDSASVRAEASTPRKTASDRSTISNR